MYIVLSIDVDARGAILSTNSYIIYCFHSFFVCHHHEGGDC